MTYVRPTPRQGLSTCVLIPGGRMSVNAIDSNTFDIPKSLYRFDIFDIDIEKIEPVVMELGPFIGVPIPNIGSVAAHNVMVKLDGTNDTSHDHIVLTEFTGLDEEPLRDHAYLGAVIHTSGSLEGINDAMLNGSGFDYGMSLVDLGLAIGPMSIKNNIFPASIDLSIKKSSGRFFNFGVNMPNVELSPNNIKFPNYLASVEVDPVSFFYTWRDGLGGYNVSAGNTQLDPNSFDNGTGGATEPNGVVSNPKWSVQKALASQTNVFIQFGTEKYDSLKEARMLFNSESFNLFPSLEGTPFVTWIFLRGGATDASLLTDAYFLQDGQFSKPIG